MTRKPSVRRSATPAKTALEPSEIDSPVVKGAAATDATTAINAVVERIKQQLAKHGIQLSMQGDQGAGSGFSVTLGRASKQGQAEGVAGAGGSETEIATQHNANAPLVIKLSGPVLIDIGAIILNSND